MAINIHDCGNCALQCDQIPNSDYYIVKLQKSRWRESNIAISPKHSDICSTSDTSSKELKNLCSSSSEKSKVCSKDSLYKDALNESKLFDKEQEQYQECHTSPVCEHHSVNYNESDETTSCTTDESSRESLYTCADEHYSECFKMKESESLVDELLNQLPRTQYVDESRKYWEMMLHCERAAFRRAASNLPLPSREARFYWHLYSTATKHSPLYQKELNQAFRITLSKLIHRQRNKKGVAIWEQLVRIKTYDGIGRKNLINNLVRFLCTQPRLESICLEGLSLTPDEGIRLLSALYHSRKTMRCVYCWRTFEKMVNIGDRDESRSRTHKKIDKYDWFRAIGTLKFLTTLSVNYAYIATPSGDLLILLAKKLGQNWFWLQLLCTEEDIIQRQNGGTKITKNVIPDVGWKEVHLWAPALKVQYAIIGIPNYDIHKWFYTKSTQVHTFTLSTSIDFKFQQPWYLNCTFKSLYSWHSDSLEVHSVNMQLQEVLHDDIDKEQWMKSIKCLMVCFKHDFEKMGVKFAIDFYCM
ncbi:uncharacterized protein LOC105661800 isoform X2 [Megachile rotundata]|uniref:uncharacterized protein LOC105661800 isoform X2 n=1 Tax=Megachile rotundata TaxID=143995 RepID=UPI003FD24293